MANNVVKNQGVELDFNHVMAKKISGHLDKVAITLVQMTGKLVHSLLIWRAKEWFGMGWQAPKRWARFVWTSMPSLWYLIRSMRHFVRSPWRWSFASTDPRNWMLWQIKNKAQKKLLTIWIFYCYFQRQISKRIND